MTCTLWFLPPSWSGVREGEGLNRRATPQPLTSSIAEIHTLTYTWSRSISRAWVISSFQLPGKWTWADCILDSGLRLPRDLLKTIVAYFCWTARSWIDRDQLRFSCQQSYWMCWLLKPRLAGRCNTLCRHAIKFSTGVAGKKSQPYLLINHSEVNLHISGTDALPSLLNVSMNMGNRLSKVLFVFGPKAFDGRVCVGRSVVKIYYMQIFKQTIIYSKEPHPLNEFDMVSAWAKSHLSRTK